ncbi:ead/Ea22-like family protein [Salmonella enterica subsp. enterica serovar Uganda]|nr:ead/Ea22-like family protein [Salmonella enterica subsp. enterica serovar Uganda]EIX2952249.1 ead/Ea22-like family protein [Salmonella enterica subsp. enterica serovar Uganda]HEH9008913.1 ead/Ea22-like family protein [Salmonella enterica]
MQNLEVKCEKLAAENAHMQQVIGDVQTLYYESDGIVGYHLNGDIAKWDDVMPDLWAETPATDAFLAEVRVQAHKEGAHFVANRMLAAWESGFIDDTAKNAADIARMILTSTEFMDDAPEGDFDRSFADGVLEDIAVQLRKEAAQ